jgi:hypothetical protein
MTGHIRPLHSGMLKAGVKSRPASNLPWLLLIPRLQEAELFQLLAAGKKQRTLTLCPVDPQR